MADVTGFEPAEVVNSKYWNHDIDFERVAQRLDRMLFLSALSIALLTLLGAAGESLGYDRWLKANTVKYRTHSLFRQGLMLYEHTFRTGPSIGCVH